MHVVWHNNVLYYFCTGKPLRQLSYRFIHHFTSLVFMHLPIYYSSKQISLLLYINCNKIVALRGIVELAPSDILPIWGIILHILVGLRGDWVGLRAYTGFGLRAYTGVRPYGMGLTAYTRRNWVGVRAYTELRPNGEEGLGHTQGYTHTGMRYAQTDQVPVCPNPPVPRSVSVSSITSTISACSWRAMTIWAMRSPSLMTNSSPDRFMSITQTSPR